MSHSKVLFAAGDFIPHRPPMLLVTHVGMLHGEAAACTVVDEAWPILENRVVPAPALVEVLAQGYAAIAGFQQKDGALTGEEDMLGFLVGVKNFTCSAVVKAGDELLVKASVAAEIGNFRVVEGQIFREGALVASGQIKVFAAPRSEVESGALGEA